MRRGSLVLLLGLLSLAAPAGASAHARSATVALDYKLVLDPRVNAIGGLEVATTPTRGAELETMLELSLRKATPTLP